MPERTITVASVVKDDYEGKVSWNVETTERIGMVKCWSFPPGPEIAEYLSAHLMEPITVTVSEKDKTSKAGKPYKQISLLGIPGVIEPAKSPQNSSQGPGKGSWRESWNQSEEGQRFQHDQMNRRTALMTAKDLVVAGSVTDGVALFTLADGFYAWLTIRDGSGSASQPPSPGASRPEHSPGATDVRVGEGAAAPSQGNGAGEGPSQDPGPPHQSSGAGDQPLAGTSEARHEPASNDASAPASDPTIAELRNHALRLYSPAELRTEAFGFYHKDLRVQDLTAEQLAELIEAREKAGALT